MKDIYKEIKNCKTKQEAVDRGLLNWEDFETWLSTYPWNN